jgi:predicted MPP superfamily phosphohydrolase
LAKSVSKNYPLRDTCDKLRPMRDKNQSPLLKVSKRGWHWVSPTWFRVGALMGGGGGAIAALVYFYARQIEPRWLDFRTRPIKLRGLASAFDGYRIVQLSDLHLAEGKLLTPDRLESIVRRVNQLRPDLILITGDFVSHVDATSHNGIARLRGLHAPDGVFAITGNHDYWSGVTDVVQAVERAGIRVLCNDHVLIRRSGAVLAIAGLDDIWEGQYDLDAALRGLPAGAPVILMAHEPNYADFAAKDGRVALQLSGHSHGGQVRLPGIGPLALPDLAYRYPMGLYRVGEMLLHVSRGIGLAEIPFRFNCRPEITTFVLAPA